jgi:hypothetical protein
VEAHVGGVGGSVALPLTINAAQSVFQSVAVPMPQSPQSPHTPRTHAPVLQATGGEGQGTGGQDDVPDLDIATFISGRPG